MAPNMLIAHCTCAAMVAALATTTSTAEVCQLHGYSTHSVADNCYEPPLLVDEDREARRWRREMNRSGWREAHVAPRMPHPVVIGEELRRLRASSGLARGRA